MDLIFILKKKKRLGPELLIFQVGSGSVGLASIPTALEQLHKKYGTLPLELLAEPAIKAGKSFCYVGSYYSQVDPIQ